MYGHKLLVNSGPVGLFPVYLLRIVFMHYEQIIGDSNINDNWRQLALEVIVTLSETAPAMIRKFGKFLGNLGMI